MRADTSQALRGAGFHHKQLSEEQRMKRGSCEYDRSRSSADLQSLDRGMSARGCQTFCWLRCVCRMPPQTSGWL